MMKCTAPKLILNLLLTGGLAVSLLLLVLMTPLAAMSKPLQAGPGPVDPPRKGPAGAVSKTLDPARRAVVTAAGISTPTTILELFSLLEPPAALRAGGIEAASIPNIAPNFPLLSAAPIFSTTDLPSTVRTFSMDWGDVDRDGDLDLAVGGPDGVAVYRNDGNKTLTRLWISGIRPWGVRWADVDGEPNLELIVVGHASGTSNCIYTSPEASASGPCFSSTAPLFRVVPGYYNNDGDIDVLVSTLSLNPSCPVELYRNDGSSLPFNNLSSCVSTEATADLATADIDNDGRLDAALGLHQSGRVAVITNSGSFPFLTTAANLITVDSGLSRIPYDFAWGDYDQDGYLDLAAAFPDREEVRIYHNDNGMAFTPTIVLPANALNSPLAVEWADFDNDGGVELAVADIPPTIYKYNGNHNFTEFATLGGLGGSRLQEIRGLDVDNDADLDLALADQFGPNRVFETSAPPLERTLTRIATGDARHVAWGDWDSDDFLDLFLSKAGSNELYLYQDGGFALPLTSFGSGGRQAAFGDPDNDGLVNLVVNNTIYNPSGGFEILAGAPSSQTSPVWGYGDIDDRLDLLIGTGDSSLVFFNTRVNPLTFAPGDSLPTFAAEAVAWSDYNRDFYLDFVIANQSQGVQVYRNNKDQSFTPIWLESTGGARSVAWSDYDGDGWPDLTVGYYTAANRIYRNQGGTGAFTSTWTSGDVRKTVSLAWGDWDNDGDLDLAVGNDGQKDQIYANLGSGTTPNLTLFWQSDEISPTTAVAWGDKDRDGDLDLAVSTADGSGVYENNYVLPFHVSGVVTQPLLPHNPAYLAVNRPGQTDAAYFFSAPDILGDLDAGGLVTFTYALFDPDSPRDPPAAAGDPLTVRTYEFSLNGGSTWTKTVFVNPFNPTIVPTRNGVTETIVWDAREDQAISDDARFRLTIVHHKRAGPVQRATTTAVSPPFRVRATTCDWPTDPSIQIIKPAEPEAGEIIQFLGSVAAGPGVLTFTWDFGDGETDTAQFVNHRYLEPGLDPPYTVRLTVTGEACPVRVEMVTKKEVSVGGDAPVKIYLPLILKSDLAAAAGAGPPGRVGGLHGRVQPERGLTQLGWSPDPASAAVDGYRIYRGARARPEAGFALLATVSAATQTYTDTTACGQMYYITAFNAAGESPPSAASYFSPVCQ